MRFKYRALKDNKIFNKVIDAESEKAVVIYLKNNGYFPLDIGKEHSASTEIFGFITNRISFTDIVDLTRQLAIMLNAGLTLVDCFDILEKQITKPVFLKLIEDLDKTIRGGSSFSAALKKYPQYFSNLYISLIKSGEASGKLSDILLRLAENLEKQREFQGKIKGALIYPIIIIIGMIGVMFVMITFVLPKLLGMYKDFNITLPMTTQILIVVSSFSTKFWPLIIATVFGGGVFVNRYLKTKAGKTQFDTMTLKLPIMGNVIKISALVTSTRTLSILIGAGVSILESLNIVVDTTENIVFQEAFKRIYKQVEKGISVGAAMEQEENIFPPILIQMTVVGEQTGHLDETLMRISKYFEMESELAVKTMTTLIEPLVLVFLGVGVGFLVLSVITPIYNLSSSIK